MTATDDLTSVIAILAEACREHDAARPKTPSRILVARTEDYAELRSWGVSAADAAVRVGVSPRTARRYEARRSEMAARGERRAA